LTLRCAFAGASPAIWLLALGAATSHALQGAAADYYRAAFLYFSGGARNGIDSSSALRSDYRKLSWGQRAWDKLLLALYLNFTLQQEVLAPRLKKLRETANTVFHGQIPGWLEQRYRDAAGHMLKWWRLLMTNTRMLVLFLLLFLGQPIYYFWFELIPLNVLFVYRSRVRKKWLNPWSSSWRRDIPPSSPFVLNIEVSEVTSRRERDAFIKFQWQIYTNDSAWVPPLIIERKGFLDRKRHPFYRHGDAALFLARKDGKIAGRIMASDDPNYNSLHETNVGCFGLFECIDDHDVAACAF